MVYFKQHFEDCNKEWVNFGSYSDSDGKSKGDIKCVVRTVIRKGKVEPLRSCLYNEFVDLDKITIIEKHEYLVLLDLWVKASKLQLQANDIMWDILGKCKASAKTNFV